VEKEKRRQNNIWHQCKERLNILFLNIMPISNEERYVIAENNYKNIDNKSEKRIKSAFHNVKFHFISTPTKRFFIETSIYNCTIGKDLIQLSNTLDINATKQCCQVPLDTEINNIYMQSYFVLNYHCSICNILACFSFLIHPFNPFIFSFCFDISVLPWIGGGYVTACIPIICIELKISVSF